MPAGASGSSQSRTKLRDPSGAPDHCRGGERFSPSQVNRRGIAVPLAKAPETSFMALSSGCRKHRRGLDELSQVRLSAESIDCRTWSRSQTADRKSLPLRASGSPISIPIALWLWRRTNGAAQYRPCALDDAWHEPLRLGYSSSILPGAESIDFWLDTGNPSGIDQNQPGVQRGVPRAVKGESCPRCAKDSLQQNSLPCDRFSIRA